MTQRAPYQQVAAHVRAMIESGELTAGADVPSENTLIEQFGFNRNTIRRALVELRAEGLITTAQGARSKVRRRPTMFYDAGRTNWRRRFDSGKPNDIAEGEAQGYQSKNQLLGVETTAAPEEIAKRFNVEPGTPLVRRRVLTTADSEPMKTTTSYYPVKLARGTPLAEPRLIRGGSSRLIEAEDGPIRRHIAEFVEELELRMPTPDEAEALIIPQGVPVARVFRTMRDADGAVLEVLDSLLPGDRYLLRYTIDVS